MMTTYTLATMGKHLTLEFILTKIPPPPTPFRVVFTLRDPNLKEAKPIETMNLESKILLPQYSLISSNATNRIKPEAEADMQY